MPKTEKKPSLHGTKHIKQPPKVQILLVDDSEEDSIIFSRFIPPYFTIHTVSDRQEAIQQCMVNHYDCLLIDYFLFDENGLQLIDQLQHHQIYLPTIVLSGVFNDEIHYELKKRGITDYLKKGHFTKEGLEQRITQCVSNYKQVSLQRFNNPMNNHRS